MSHVTMWLCLASAVAFVSIGVVRLVAWSSAQRLRRLDAEYRAFAMIAQAKRDARRAIELERSVSALEAQWAVRS